MFSLTWNCASAWLIAAGLAVFVFSFMFDPDQSLYLAWTDAVAAALVVSGMICAIVSIVSTIIPRR